MNIEQNIDKIKRYIEILNVELEYEVKISTHFKELKVLIDKHESYSKQNFGQKLDEFEIKIKRIDGGSFEIDKFNKELQDIENKYYKSYKDIKEINKDIRLKIFRINEIIELYYDNIKKRPINLD